MIFTFGNLIVLLTVCAVVVILRQYDRNNRSLSKIRKYADSVRAELDRIVQERIEQVRDMAIDFDVNYKRGRALVTRLSNIDSISKHKVDDYQQRLTYLDKKVDRATDTISQLDTYHKNSSEQFTHFQKYIRQIERQFEAISNSATSLEQLRDSLPGILSDQQQRFRQLIDDKYRTLEQGMASLADQHRKQRADSERIYREHTQELRVVGKRVHQRVTSVARALTLRERAQRRALSEHIAVVARDHNMRSEEVRTQYVEQMNQLIDKERAEIAAHMRQILAQQMQEVRDAQQNELQNLNIDGDQQREQLRQQQDERLQQLEEMLAERQQAMEAELQDFNTDGDQQRQQFRQQQDERLKQLEVMLAERQLTVEEALQGLNTDIDQQRQQFRQQQDEQLQQLQQMIAKQKQMMEAELQNLNTDGDQQRRAVPTAAG